MKIEFFYKKTGKPVPDQDFYFIDCDGVVYELIDGLETAPTIGWRMVINK
jgi:hypothetical protein